MDVLDAIFTRRSIRSFTGEPVSEDNLKTILRAGCAAPSAHNFQPWHFIVIRDMSTLEKIASFHKYAKMLPSAGCCIIVCGDSEKQNKNGFLIADCSAAIQNILLAAHGLGLGAVWCGLYPVEEYLKALSELFNLPETIVPIGMVALGHKSKDAEPADRFDEAKVHMEKW